MKKNSNFPDGYKKLSETEKMYFKQMNAKSGVLFISAPPGYAKSAIMRSIANKLNAQYFDIRLSMVDETDVGLFPTIDKINIGGVDKKALVHVVPEWAYRANEKLTIIHFEELNRANINVRNAALQILLEREIGSFFKFNENVLMCSSGNLGEKDGTEVEEFDAALNNRLIHVEHKLNIEDWIENYAYEHVCPTIVNFLKNYRELYYKAPVGDENNKAYATPRSWTFLSDYILSNYGTGEFETRYILGETILDEQTSQPKLFKKFPPIEEWIDDIRTIVHSYVGPSGLKFYKYCEDTLRLSLDDILNNFKKHELDVKSFNRDKKSELLSSMRERKVSQLNSKQKNNLIDFLMTITKDECLGYIVHVLDTEYSVDSTEEENLSSAEFLSDKKFKKYRANIRKYVDDSQKDDSQKDDSQKDDE